MYQTQNLGNIANAASGTSDAFAIENAGKLAFGVRFDGSNGGQSGNVTVALEFSVDGGTTWVSPLTGSYSYTVATSGTTARFDARILTVPGTHGTTPYAPGAPAAPACRIKITNGSTHAINSVSVHLLATA